MRFQLSVRSEEDCFFDGPEGKVIEGADWREALRDYVSSEAGLSG